MRGVPHVILSACACEVLQMCDMHHCDEVPRVREVPHVCTVGLLSARKGVRQGFPQQALAPPAHASTSRSARIELGLHLPSHVVSASPLNGFTW